MSNEWKSSFEMTEELFRALNPHLFGDEIDCSEEINDSIPAFMVGIDEVPVDSVSDADTPDKLIKLYGKEKDEKL